MVHGQVQTIADSWREKGSQTRSSITRTLEPKDSATTLEVNRQRRTQRHKAQTAPADEAQILEEALGGLHLNASQREAEARAKVAQRRAQKVARKVARKAKEHHFSETTRNLLRQYELDPSIEISKNQRRKVLRLQMEQKQKHGKRKESQKAHERQDPDPIPPQKREGNRKIRITANGVGLEPIEPDRYVPDYRPSDNRASDDQPCKPRLLRSNHRTRGKIPTNSGDLGDTPSVGLQRETRGHDRYVPAHGSNARNHAPHNSRYPLRSNYRTPGDSRTNNAEGLGSITESTAEGMLLVEDSEWMDIDDISSRTARVQLA